MPDESCRKCGGGILVSRCRECKMPLEIACKSCTDTTYYTCCCIKNIASTPYTCVVSA